MKPDVTSAYRLSAGHNASPVKLIVILYEQLIKDLRRAVGAMEKKDVEARSREIDHALIVLARLQGTLNKAQGGEISRGLDHFYHLLRSSLLTAQVRNIPEMLNKQIKNLLQLREAWVEVDRVESAGSQAEGAQSEYAAKDQPVSPAAAGEPTRSAQWSG